MKEIKKSDFKFERIGYGLYNVTYTTPSTKKVWKSQISDMNLVPEVLYKAEPNQDIMAALVKKIKKGDK